MPTYNDLKAIYFNCTLTKSPADSHTGRLINVSKAIMEKQGVQVDVIRTIDHDIASGVYPDMREKGWDVDEWPELYKKVQAADIVVIAGPIWLGDNSSETKKVIERLYAQSSDTKENGQYSFYNKVGGALITGNEDGVKHCAMNILYSLQHIGFTIPPDSDSGWIGEIGPGPSYGDKKDDGGHWGYDNDFTNRNTTVAVWNMLHMARILKDSGGIPAYGNVAKQWEDGERFGFENPTALDS